MCFNLPLIMYKIVYPVITGLIFLFLLSGQAFAQVNMTQGLRAYYPFTGNANDVSGNNNNPSFNNASLTPDRFGNANSAYLFNGTNNYIRIPNSSSLNMAGPMSIAMWIKVNGFYQGTCHGNNLLMKGDDDSNPNIYYLRFDDFAYTNGQHCSIPVPDITHENLFGRGTLNPPGGYTPYVPANQWMSVVYIYDGTTAKLYVDCQLKISSSASGFNFTNAYDLFLGRMNHPSYPYWFNGVMDEVRIYDRALTADEVNWFGGCGTPDLTSSQFFTTTQIAQGTYIDEVIALRNVGSAPTNGTISFTITNYSALTGLSVSPINPGISVPIGIDTYTMDNGWTFNSGSGSFTSNNVIPQNVTAYIGIRITRGTAPNQGANGAVTQTTTIAPGTGGGETPTTNNSISNTLLKF